MKKIYVAPRMGKSTEVYEELICQSPTGPNVFTGQSADISGTSGSYSVDAESKDRSVDFSDDESIW